MAPIDSRDRKNEYGKEVGDEEMVRKWKDRGYIYVKSTRA
jgi:hypothetical protein